jgi:NAD kinase
MGKFEKAIIVRSKTRLDLITEQYNTVSQAKFAIERQREIVEESTHFLDAKLQESWQTNRKKRKQEKGSGEISDFKEEHDQYSQILESVQNIVAKHLKIKVVENSFLPSFMFAENDLVIVIGQDGLVANTAKYTNQLPILAINPDATRFDGALLPFTLQTFERAFLQVLQDRYKYQLVTMAEAVLNDGQRLLAFNDFFIGTASHTSARYLITHDGYTETHSSSGIIVSTGAGATGWLSSLFNMANGIHRVFNPTLPQPCLPPAVTRDSEKLVFIVREPFVSKTSQAQLVAGIITPQKELVLESLMAKTGVIFSDGLESDKLKFNSGNIARIGIAKEKAKLVLPA